MLKFLRTVHMLISKLHVNYLDNYLESIPLLLISVTLILAAFYSTIFFKEVPAVIFSVSIF